MKYIYELTIRFKGIIRNAYLDNDIFNNIFFSFDKAVEIGKNILKDSINSYSKYMDLELEEIEDIIEYTFKIKKISCNFNNFDNDELLQEYYQKTIRYIHKDNLYDHLLSIIDYIDYYLDFNGNIISIETANNIDYFNPKSFDFNINYHLKDFKIGDKVKIKYDTSGKIYEIFDIMNKDNIIYNSKDPLYFKQGYCLTDIYNDYCNKYTCLHFDEDLVRSSDIEYYNFYKSWNWYDNKNNIIGTYDDYINNRIKKDD